MSKKIILYGSYKPGRALDEFIMLLVKELVKDDKVIFITGGDKTDSIEKKSVDKANGHR